jgi:hypothetical protein
LKGGVNLEDRDPYDYARAVRLFPAKIKVTVSFDLLITKVGDIPLNISLFGHSTSGPGLTWGMSAQALNGKRFACRIEADTHTHQYSLFLRDSPIARGAVLAKTVDLFTGISFRTGPSRPIIDRTTTSVTNDVPTEPTSYSIQRLTIR